MPTAVQLPYSREPAKKVGRRVFRKQLLPIGSVDHPKHGRLDFDKPLLKDLVAEFEKGTYDTVPFLLSNDKAEHHNDPERIRGEVVGLDIQPDGLYGLIEMGDRGAQVIEDSPKLPVSVRIVPPGYSQNERAALQHVLATVDPAAKGMKPWEAIEASAGTKVIDLSDGQVTVSTMSTDAQTADADELSKDDIGLLSKFAEKLRKRAGSKDDETDERDTAADDAEAERILASLNLDEIAESESDKDDEEEDESEGDEEREEETAAAALSNEDREALELANRNAEAANRRASELETRLAAERWRSEKGDLLRAGVPPSMIDLAAPVLELASVEPIELSNSKSVDPQKVVRDLLQSAKGTIDMSERGSSFADDDEAAAAKDAAKKWKDGGS